MDEKKTQIQLKLIANLIEGLLANKDGVIFDASLCTQERCIRFSTPMLESVFPSVKTASGAWKNGRFLMYEVFNEAKRFEVAASVSYAGLTSAQKESCRQLLAACNVAADDGRSPIHLRTWNYGAAACDAQGILTALQVFFDYELPYFETELAAWKTNHDRHVKLFPQLDQDILVVEEAPSGLLIEGAAKDVLSNKYERNPEARRRCIAAHGSACCICGLDFGEAYGPEFTGRIEVHHIVPLRMIGSSYAVDPVHDLIPVCPNCHMVLHSKPGGGFYTPDEVRGILRKQEMRQGHTV